jgi:hypothetical protein
MFKCLGLQRISLLHFLQSHRDGRWWSIARQVFGSYPLQSEIREVDECLGILEYYAPC